VRVFVYEYITGGGLPPGEKVPPSFFEEGAAMVTALAGDFIAAGHDVRCFQGRSSGGHLADIAGAEMIPIHNELDHRQQLVAAAGWAGKAIVIAPETGGVMLSIVQHLAPQVELLSPGEKLVQIATDKVLTNQWLRSCGVPVPNQFALPAGELLRTQLDFPLIAKPRFGAGSEGVHLVYNDAQIAAIPVNEFWVLEQLVAGRSVSAAVICGSESWLAMPACTQRFSGGQFIYSGGECPLPHHLNERATALAVAAVAALPAAAGWVGVDLILGDDSSGRDDYVIEVNPRLTTSYIGVRAAIDANPASLMLDLAEGRPVAPPTPVAHVSFSHNGQLSLQVL